ncbi:MAG: hypothetical protein BAJALOKI1v1_860011 [Promethearchaeota archaeon]|nr:MAG: hypothetical protein BAJALOKI1v1_860011 [Candidatus Lokiarchaeota archaeon]
MKSGNYSLFGDSFYFLLIFLLKQNQNRKQKKYIEKAPHLYINKLKIILIAKCESLWSHLNGMK